MATSDAIPQLADIMGGTSSIADQGRLEVCNWDIAAMSLQRKPTSPVRLADLHSGAKLTSASHLVADIQDTTRMGQKQPFAWLINSRKNSRGSRLFLRNGRLNRS